MLNKIYWLNESVNPLLYTEAYKTHTHINHICPHIQWHESHYNLILFTGTPTKQITHHHPQVTRWFLPGNHLHLGMWSSTNIHVLWQDTVGVSLKTWNRAHDILSFSFLKRTCYLPKWPENVQINKFVVINVKPPTSLAFKNAGEHLTVSHPRS